MSEMAVVGVHCMRSSAGADGDKDRNIWRCNRIIGGGAVWVKQWCDTKGNEKSFMMGVFSCLWCVMSGGDGGANLGLGLAVNSVWWWH